jgi:YVTN family beta-propeller protein
VTHGDDRLEEALRSVGDDYLRRNPADLFRARTRVRQLRRRHRMRAAATTAVAAAAIVAIAVLAWPATDSVPDRPRPAGEIELPEGTISIPVGDAPVEVAVGEGAIWVSNTGDSSVSRIDPATNEATEVVGVAGEPGDLAVGGGGEVWVANREIGAVHRIDPTTGTTTPDRRVDVGFAGTPLDLAIDEYLWISVVERQLIQVDPVSGEIVRRIDSIRPVNVAARPGGVFVLEADGSVTRLDPVTGQPNGVELSFDVEGRGDVHYYGGNLWVAEGDGSTLFSAPADGSGEIRSYTFRGTYMEMVKVPEGILVLSDLGDGAAVLTLVDAVTRATTEMGEIEGGPSDLVSGADDLWVSTSATDSVARIPSL